MHAILWAADGPLGGILAGLGKLLGVDTSGMSGTVALIAIAFAAWTWYSRLKPGPKPDPQPTPEPTPDPKPSPTPTPDLGDLVRVLVPALLPKLGDLIENILARKLDAIPELPKSAVESATSIETDQDMAVVHHELSRGLTDVVGSINDVNRRRAIDPDKAEISPAVAVAIINQIIAIYPLLKVVLRRRGVKVPEETPGQVTLATMPVAARGASHVEPSKELAK